jgi:hypothetical protein
MRQSTKTKKNQKRAAVLRVLRCGAGAFAARCSLPNGEWPFCIYICTYALVQKRVKSFFPWSHGRVGVGLLDAFAIGH